MPAGQSTERLIKSLEHNGYKVSYFENHEDAAEYLDHEIDNRVVGFGDSQTMIKMELYKRLSSHNEVWDPNQGANNGEFIEIGKKCLTTEVFLTSVNAMAETGEMVNIDGTGNRVAGSLFGHKKVYFVVSTNKLEPDLERAIYRARNIAGPKNAAKYNLHTPCVRSGEARCFDCDAPGRICNALVIYLRKMEDLPEAEVVIIDEEMGF